MSSRNGKDIPLTGKCKCCGYVFPVEELNEVGICPECEENPFDDEDDENYFDNEEEE